MNTIENILPGLHPCLQNLAKNKFERNLTPGERGGNRTNRFSNDHDIEGYAQLLWGTLASVGWLDEMALELTTFREIGLPITSNDREVWRFAQLNGLILITNNRNMKDENSLEQTLREENRLSSLPVLTIGNLERLAEPDCRERCADMLIEISLDIENHLGRGRIYIP